MKDFIYAYVRKIPFKYDVNKKICNERLSYLESIKQNGIMKVTSHVYHSPEEIGFINR